MNKIQRRRYETFHRVFAFIAHYPELFPENTRAGDLATTFRSTFQAIQENARDQLGGVQVLTTETEEKRKACDVLRSRVRQLVRTSRLVSQSVPQFNEPFHLPKTKGDPALVKIAREIDERVSAFRDAFVHSGLPADFIESFKAAIEKVEDAISKGKAAAAAQGSSTQDTGDPDRSA